MVEYTYNLYKDGEIIDTQTVNQNIPATFTLDTTGTYKISVSVTLNTGFTFTEESGEYIIDKEMPEITIEDETFTITNIKNLPEVTAKDNHDGDLSNKITNNLKDLDLTTSGNKTLTYIVSDEAGNTSSVSLNLEVTSHSSELLILLSLITVILVALLVYFNRLRRAFKLEKRINAYTIEPLNKKNSFLYR